MVGEDDDGQAGDVGGSIEHRVHDAGPRLAFASERDARTKSAEKSNNSLDWTPSDMLRAVANRIDRGEVAAHCAVLVVVDEGIEEIVTFSAGTKSVLETHGILILGATA